MGVIEYLQNQQGFQNDDEPSLLFAQSNKNSKFPDIFLFSNFGYCTSNAIGAQSNITTYYVEDNVAVQDHWALPPLEYSLSGVVGEVVYIPPNTWASWVQKHVTDFLEPLGMLAPTVSNYTRAAVNVARQVESSVQRYGQIARQIYSSWGGNVNSNIISNQQYVFEQLLSIRNSRELVTVYTPYGKFMNLAITNVQMKQQESVYQSTIEVRFQQWLNVSTLESRPATEAEKAAVVGLQKQPTQQNAYSGKRELTSYFYELSQGRGNTYRL